MTKRGTAYELALTQIIEAIEPNALVTQGAWVDGPDGSREVDVMIEHQVLDDTRRFLFECKDYKKKRRIGIATLDAFESKLRDLGADGGAICSNADFSDPARRKAARCDIGLIGVLRTSDKPNFDIIEYFERREVTFPDGRLDMNAKWLASFPSSQKHFLNEKLFSGYSIADFALFIFCYGMMQYPVVNGRPEFVYEFPEALTASEFPDNGIKSISASADIRGAWLRKKSRISATQAIYLWHHHKIIVPHGEERVTFHDAAFDDPKYWKKQPLRENSSMMELCLIGLSNLGVKPDPKLASIINFRSIKLVNPSANLTTSITKSAYSKDYRKRLKEQKLTG